VGVLKGAVVFLADLIRAVSIPFALDFVGLASYGEGTRSAGAITITADLSGPIHDRHVIVIEDIVDSGRTLAFLRQHLGRRNPLSLRVCVLLDKAGRREVQVPLDYVGFVVPDEFVVGYGLGHGDLYRNLPYVAGLEAEPSA
jgi:hypoxanthine phosphoribosyltransferase